MTFSMDVEVDGSDLADQLADTATQKRLTEDVARDWYSGMQEKLLEAGDEEQYEVFSIAQAMLPPVWNGEEWVIAVEHEAAGYFEFGTDKHTVRPNESKMLKFPWPDAPEDIKEDFRPQWRDPSHWLEEPEVLLPKSEVEGIEELRYIRNSAEEL